MPDPRITWYHGTPRPGPRQTIGVLEVRADGTCRAVLGERVEVDGRCHVRLAREARGGKDALDTRWWSLIIDSKNKVCTVRNGSCGDALNTADVPVVLRAPEELELLAERTMIAVDDGPSVFPRWRRRSEQTAAT